MMSRPGKRRDVGGDPQTSLPLGARSKTSEQSRSGREAGPGLPCDHLQPPM